MLNTGVSRFFLFLSSVVIENGLIRALFEIGLDGVSGGLILFECIKLMDLRRTINALYIWVSLFEAKSDRRNRDTIFASIRGKI